MDTMMVPGHVSAEMPKRPRSPPTATRVIEVLAYPSVQLLDVTGPVQVFASANDFAAEAGATPPYKLRLVTQAGRSVTASAGVEVAAVALPPIGAPLDTLMIAGGQGVDAAAADPALVDWVRQRAKDARRVASVCTGAFLLAASGVLDGKRVATHWSLCAELARRFPAIGVEPDPIFVRDGSIWTSAGVTAGIDLALALVEQDLGRAAALRLRIGGNDASQFHAVVGGQSTRLPLPVRLLSRRFRRNFSGVDAKSTSSSRTSSSSSAFVPSIRRIQRPDRKPRLPRSSSPDAGLIMSRSLFCDAAKNLCNATEISVSFADESYRGAK
jgi:transcriptional regulator GlxA family with amidase domain